MTREQIDPTIRSVEIGFEGEIYVNDEDGFRMSRTDDSDPLKPEFIAGPDATGAAGSSSEQRNSSDSKMCNFMTMLNEVLTKQ